jgi:hypothetical protein
MHTERVNRHGTHHARVPERSGSAGAAAAAAVAPRSRRVPDTERAPSGREHPMAGGKGVRRAPKDSSNGGERAPDSRRTATGSPGGSDLLHNGLSTTWPKRAQAHTRPHARTTCGRAVGTAAVGTWATRWRIAVAGAPGRGAAAERRLVWRVPAARAAAGVGEVEGREGVGAARAGVRRRRSAVGRVPA